MTAHRDRVAVVRLALIAVLLAVLIPGVGGLGADAFAAPKSAAKVLSFSIAPGTIERITAPWAPFTVSILKNGAVDARDNKTLISLSTSPGATGFLAGALTQTVSAGVATFSGISYDRAETISLVATASGSTMAPAASNQVTVAAPYVQFNPPPGPTQVIGKVWAPLTVQVMFAGAVETGDNTTSVSIYSTGTGFLYGTTTKTVSGGIAAFNDLFYNKEEAFEVWAVPTTYGMTPSPHVPVSVVASRLVFSPQPASPQTVGQVWAPFSVRIENGGALDTADNSTQITISRASGTGTVSGTRTRTVAGGIATFDDIAYNVAETMTLEAGVVGGSWTPPTNSSPVTVVPGFSVTGTNPLPGATNVPTSSVVSASFSTPLDPASVTSATFSVTGPQGQVAGTYSFADNGYRCVFTPSAALASGASYIASLSTGIRSIGGGYLPQVHSWSFTTVAIAAGWDAAQLIYSDNYGDALHLDVAVTGAGRAMATWAQYYQPSNRITTYASTLPLPAPTWSYPAWLSGAADVYHPKVAADGSDNGVVVWQQFTATGHDIAGARFDGTSWSPPGVIASPGSWYENEPGLAMNSGGFGLALWRQYNPATAGYRIYGSRCVPGSPAWNAPEVVSDPTNVPNPDHLKAPRAALDDFANAATAWEHNDWGLPGMSRISSNMFKGGGPWLPQYQVGYSDNNGRPDVALDSFGNPMVVWAEAGRISAVHHNGAAWETPQTLSVGDYATNPRIASGANGGVLTAVWQTSFTDNVSTRYLLWMRRYVAGAWSFAMPLPAFNDTAPKLNPQVAVDDAGNELFVWQALDNSVSPYSFVYAVRYEAATSSWAGPVGVSSGPYPGFASDPVLAGDARGNAIVVWRQPYGSYYGVFGARYRSGR